MYSKIKNPETGRIVKVNSLLGKRIINNYIQSGGIKIAKVLPIAGILSGLTPALGRHFPASPEPHTQCVNANACARDGILRRDPGAAPIAPVFDEQGRPTRFVGRNYYPRDTRTFVGRAEAAAYEAEDQRKHWGWSMKDRLDGEIEDELDRQVLLRERGERDEPRVPTQLFGPDGRAYYDTGVDTGVEPVDIYDHYDPDPGGVRAPPRGADGFFTQGAAPPPPADEAKREGWQQSRKGRHS
jgi:hypothetical protein